MVVAFNYTYVKKCNLVHFEFTMSWTKRLKKECDVMQKDYFSPGIHKTH